MSRPSWDDTFLDVCHVMAKRSKDESTQTATVIVGPDHEIRSVGYNCFPRGFTDDITQKRPEKYLMIEHGERNAVYNAARMGVSLLECTAYVLGIPCSRCSRALIQSGIKEVVLGELISGKGSHWMADAYYSLDMLFKCDVAVRLKNASFYDQWLHQGENEYLIGDKSFKQPDDGINPNPCGT